ncbi:MAG: sugar phosphate isomerase/epimerase [Planctomycetes bacterium]|nr:sugar phosphate isomerase/epimerase [Planctomycetota bacterium]
MKYGIRNNSLKMDWDESYAAAAEIGFDGVEICTTKEEHMPRVLEAERRQKSKDLAKAAGVETCAISYGYIRQTSFIDEDAATRQKGVENMNTMIDVAKDMGCFGILCPTFDREKIDIDEQETERFVECYKQCAPKAEQEQIYLAIETSFSVELLQKIVGAVGSPYVKVYQDVSNALFYGHDTVDVLKRLGSDICMIHIKDSEGKPLGEGDVDWDGTLQAIRDMGYDDWLVFETGPGDDPVAMAKRNLDWLKERME